MATKSRVLIVGSGAIGLRTAVELLKKQIPVALVSPSSPLATENCSQGAGGLWMPFHCDDPRTHDWAMETLNELYPLSIDDETSNKNDLVEQVPCVGLKQNHAGGDLPAWTSDARLEFQHLTAEMLHWQNASLFGYKIPSQQTMLASGYRHAWLWKSPIVNSPKMLQHMMQQVETSDCTINMNLTTGEWYNSLDDMAQVAKSMDCDTIINCTGLGAKQLCGDEKLVGARGILLHFDRATAQRTYIAPSNAPVELTRDAAIFAEEGPWGTETEPCYMIPRGNVLVVGGSYLEGDDRTEMLPQERQRLMDNARLLGIQKNVDPISEWTGFRPARPTTMLQYHNDTFQDGRIKMIHSYGHGGSGWTVNVGVAKDTVKLILNE